MTSPSRNTFQYKDGNSFQESHFVLFAVILTWALFTRPLFAAPPSIEALFSPITVTYGSAAPQSINVYNGFTDDLTPDNVLLYTASSSDPNIVSVSSINSTNGLLTLNFGNAGSATVTITATDEENFSVSNNLSVTINKTNQIITFTPPLPASATYGDPNIPLTTTTSSGLPVTFTKTGSCAITGTNMVKFTGAGICTISASQSGNTNYNAAPVNSSMITINKKLLTAIPDNQVRAYGNPDPILTISYNGFVVATDKNTLTTSPNIPPTATTVPTTSITSNVGTYNIVLSGGSHKNYNYDISAKGTLTINKANLTAQVVSATREYGQANPSFTFSYQGLKNGESGSVIDIPPTANGSAATLTSPPGNYSIPCSGGSDGNYDISICNSGTLTITKAQQSITFGGLATKTYGDNPFQVTATATSNLVPTFTTTGNCTVGGNTVTITGAGNCTVIASQEGDINYNPAPPVSQSFTINKKELIITVDDKSRPYGDPNPTFTFSYVGFVPGENESVLNVPPTGETNATFTSEVALYTIIPNGAEDDNYFFTYHKGTLEVIQANITAKVADIQRVYSAPNPIFTFVYTGLKNNETGEVIDTPPIADGSSVDETTPLGNYLIPCSGGTDHNYNITNCDAGLLTITKANAAPDITSVSPRITTSDQEVIINVDVPPQSPATASPSGNVTISDGTESCQTTIDQGRCSITFKTLGTKLLRAFYEGDDYFNKSGSTVAPHVVRETGVVVNPVSVQAQEAGLPGEYTLSLLTFPRGPVEVTAWGGKQTEISLDGIYYFSNRTVTLANLTPQTIYVRGTDDVLIEGLHQGVITHAITGTVIDPKYPPSMEVANLSVNLVDNDPGVIISPSNLSMTEGTLPSMYTIRFSTPPARPVTLTISAEHQAVVKPDMITFMPDITALEPHVVYVNAIDDYKVEGSHQALLSHQISIGDGENYREILNLDKVILNLTDPPKVVPLPVNTVDLLVRIEGEGEVQSNIIGIHCHTPDKQCLASYPQATLVTLTPIPKPGYYFSSWGGATDCADNQVQMVNSVLCVAYFQKIESTTPPADEKSTTSPESTSPEELPLPSTQESSEGETPEQPVDSKTSPPDGQPTPLEPPSSVQELPEETTSGQQTATTEQTPAISQENPIEESPSIDSLSQPILLEITVLGGGSIQYETNVCESTCLSEHTQGTLVSLTALPYDGFRFDGWSGNCQGSEVKTNIEMSNTNKQCFAQFVPIQVHTAPTTIENNVFPCPPEETLDWICNAQGATLHQDLTIHAHGNLSNAVVVKSIDNQGWASNLVIESSGSVKGGIITGYINNQGTMADFEFRGIAIVGGKLAGKITNTSKVGGYLENVEFAANASVKGGRLKGEIQGDKKFPTRLEDVIVLSGSHLSGVILGNHVTVQENVLIDSPQLPLPTLGTASAYDAEGKPVETHSKFSGGIAINRQEKIFSIKAKIKPLSSTVVNIKGNITVDPLHVGHTAELVLYVSYQRTLKDKFIYLMVDHQGKLLPWDEDPGTLVAFQTEVILKQEMAVSLYKGLLTTEGIVNVYFGYRLEDGTMITSSQAIELNVSR